MRHCILPAGAPSSGRGELHLIRLLTLLLVWTAALALPLVAAPAARAMTTAAPCAMETAGMADHNEMGCCDHGEGAPDQKAPCKPGMACFATPAALAPAAGLEVAVVAFDSIDLALAPTRALPSRPPDRALRPPIAL